MTNFELRFHSHDDNGDKDTFKDLVIYEDDLRVLCERPYLILEYKGEHIRIRKDAIKILYKAFIE